ncbi:MAG: 4a-hydroxytetrahydrobiopterin dehydratase [Ilumatobacteraceae bacterium]
MSPEPDDKQTLTRNEVAGELLGDWRYLAGKLHSRFATGTFAAGVALVDRIGAEADKVDHHPDIDLRYTHVDITLRSHDVGGITRRDIRLARVISEIADRAAHRALTDELQVIGLVLDTAEADMIRPFWAAVLGLQPEDGLDRLLSDPDGHTPGLLLKQTDADADAEPWQRFHINIDVPPDAAPERVRKALDAGGTLLSDEHAPAWWTLADPQGNRAAIATWEGRE